MGDKILGTRSMLNPRQQWCCRVPGARRCLQETQSPEHTPTDSALNSERRKTWSAWLAGWLAGFVLPPLAGVTAGLILLFTGEKFKVARGTDWAPWGEALPATR